MEYIDKSNHYRDSLIHALRQEASGNPDATPEVVIGKISALVTKEIKPSTQELFNVIALLVESQSKDGET